MRAYGLCISLLAAFGVVSTGSAKAPATIEARTLDGRVFRLDEMRGAVVIVNFWATWCTPCRAEMPAFDTYYQRHHGDGLEMIAISMDNASKGKAVRALAAGYHFPVIMAGDAKIPTGFRPSQLPLTLIFDRSGVLRFDSRQHPGLVDAGMLDRVIGPMLGERSGR